MQPGVVAEALALEETDGGHRGRALVAVGDRALGGMLMAQALMAAAATVPSTHAPQSAHTVFLGTAPVNEWVEFRTTALRDGRSLCARRVDAVHEGRAVLTALLSFHAPEDGPVHALDRPADVREPAELADAIEGIDPDVPGGGRTGWDQGFDLRFGRVDPPGMRFWVKPAQALDGGPVEAAATLMWASDLRGTFAGMRRAGWPATPTSTAVSLDHSIWFSGPVSFDDWALVDTRADVLINARPLNQSRIWHRDGRYLATCAQEGMVRIRT